MEVLSALATKTPLPGEAPFLVASKPHLLEASALLLSEDTADQASAFPSTTDLSATMDLSVAPETRTSALQAMRDAFVVVTATMALATETMSVPQVTNVACAAILAEETHIRARMSVPLVTKDAFVVSEDLLTVAKTNALQVMRDANVAPSVAPATPAVMATLTALNPLPVLDTVDLVPPQHQLATPAAPAAMATRATTMVDAAGDQLIC